MVVEAGILLVVEVMNQPHHRPFVFVFAEFAGVSAQAGLDRQAMFAQIFRESVFS
jgi:hypothetical protein